MKLRLKSLIIISICVFLYALYYWALPFAVNIKGKIPLIQEMVKKQTGAQIEIKEPEIKMGLIPAVWLEASYIGIKGDKSHLQSPLSVVNPKVKIPLLPLIFGKIQLAYLSCDKMQADFRIDKKSRLYIGNYLILKSDNQKISFEDSYMDIGDYKISFKDEINNKNILLNGSYFSLDKYNPNKYLKFSTNSKININGHNSAINMDVDLKLPINKSFDTDDILFDGTLTNLNLKDIEPYVKQASKNKVKQISGTLNIAADTKLQKLGKKRIKTQMAIENIFLKLENSRFPLAYKNKLNINAVCDFSRNTLDVQKLQILSKGISMNLKGKVHQMSSKDPVMNLYLNIAKSRLEDFVPFLPETDGAQLGVNLIALKKYGYYSDLDGNLSIKGKASKPELSGEFISTNGYVVRPLNIPKATVKLKFDKYKLNLDILVPTSRTDNVIVKGPVELYGDRNADLTVLSTPNVDLKTTQLILNPLHEIFYFDIGPVPVMDLRGIGNISLKIQGNKNKPHLDGVLNFINTDASFNGINMTLRNVDGSLYFKDKQTHFITRKAYLDNNPIKVDGTCSLLGDLDYNIASSNQDIAMLINVLDTSPMLKDVKAQIPPFKSASGKLNLNIKLKGKVQSVDDFKFGKNVFASGNIKLLGNTLALNGLGAPIKNLYGNVQFDDKQSEFNLYSVIDKSKVYIKGKVKHDKTDLDIKGNLRNSPFHLSGTIRNMFQKNQSVDFKLYADNFDIASVKGLTKYPFVNENQRGLINEISDASGHVNIRATYRNNVLNSRIKLDNISFVDSSFNIPVKIYSGSLEINKDKLTLYKINSSADSMPLFVDGLITNIYKKPNFNIYLNSKPTQAFIEKYINKNAIYPLRIKGDILYSARIQGTKDSFSTKAEVALDQDSNIYYMGSTLGDINNPIRMYLDTNVSKNSINVSNFQYDKLITSQNNREFISQQLNAKGKINIKGKNIYFNNFRVKTQNPTDAKIFNIAFKKPLVKQGLFTSNVSINGPINLPKMTGNVIFTGIDIPLLDTTIKDISLDFGPDYVGIKSKGEVFSNKIVLSANMKNSFAPPYELNNVDIYFGNLNLNEAMKSLSKIQVESDIRRAPEQKQGFDITDIVIKNGKLKADSVLVKNIFAKNLSSDFSLNEKLLFSLDNFRFDVADGVVNGNFKYNLLNANTALSLNVNNVNANAMSEALFDLPNQIYGSLTGDVLLSCNGRTHTTCMNTLSGKGGFRVAEGRMPKLGSLEYLLKAANLVKSGVTGVTINSVIDLITPLKTGNFESINGSFDINGGVASFIQIFSKGKDLSLFLTGTYNFQTLIADMEVFGRLSKKISNALGTIGNTSINTLFNTIPGLHLDETDKAEFVKNFNKIPGFELNDKTYRIFSAEIYGDINGENYVKSFRWVD